MKDSTKGKDVLQPVSLCNNNTRICLLRYSSSPLAAAASIGFSKQSIQWIDTAVASSGWIEPN